MVDGGSRFTGLLALAQSLCCTIKKKSGICLGARKRGATGDFALIPGSSLFFRATLFLDGPSKRGGGARLHASRLAGFLHFGHLGRKKTALVAVVWGDC